MHQCDDARRSQDDIDVHLYADDGDLVAVVRDKGHGFNIASFDRESPPSPFQADGRGLFLMAHLMDELELHSDAGLEVRMVKRGAVAPAMQVPTVEGGLAPVEHGVDVLPKQARLHIMLEEIDEGFIALDWEYRIVYVNAQAERLFDQPHEALLRRDFWSLESIDTGEMRAACRAAMEVGKPSVVEHLCPVSHLWYEIRVYPTLAGISLYVRSIEERKRAEVGQRETAEALQQKTEDLLERIRLDEVLLSVDQLIHSTLEIEEIMQRALDRSLAALEVTAGTVELRDGSSWLLRFECGGGPGERGLRRSDREVPVAARVAQTGAVVAIANMLDDADTAQFAFEHRVRSCLAVPLVARENVVGCFAVWSRQPRVFTGAEVEFAQKLASSVSLALENSRLYEQEALAARMGEAPVGFLWRVVYGSRVHPVWVLLASIAIQALVLLTLTVVIDAESVYGLPGSVLTLIVVITGAIAGALVGGLAAIAGGALFYVITADFGQRVSMMTAVVGTCIWVVAAVLVGYLAEGLRTQAERRRAAGFALAKAAAVREAEQAEQRRVESLAAELRVEQEQLRTMIEQTDTSIVILDREFRFVVVNSAYARGAGLAPGALIGRSYFDVDPHAEKQAIFERARDTGEAVEQRARPFVSPDRRERGETYWDWRLAPVMDASGQVRTLVLSLVDVTERVRSAQLGETLDALNERISSRLDAHHIRAAVLELAGEALGADGGWFAAKARGFWRIEQTWNVSAALEAETLAPDELPLGEEAIREQRAIFSIDYAEHEHANVALQEAIGFTTAIAIPLSRGDGAVGCLYFIHRARRQHSASEADFARKVSAITSQALENARLLDDVQRVAMTLQENLIHPLGSFYGMELGRVSQTAYHPELVGGDFSHVFAVGGDRLGILIGDVEGKGIRAAGLTETVRSAVVAFSLVDPSPDYVLGKTNELLLEGAGKDQFVTACFLLVDLATGATSYAIAGHPAPVLLRDSSCTSLPGRHGLPLGAFQNERHYELSHLSLTYGDCLVLFTDGVTEARREGELFGERRVLETVRTLGGVPAQEVAERLRAAASAFASELRDDLQILTVRYMRR